MKIFGIRVKTLANLFGIVWLGSLVAFFGLGYAVLQPENMLSADLLRILSTVIISTGIFSFALAVVLYFLHFVNSDNTQAKKKVRKKKGDNLASIKHGALVSSVVGLSIIGILLLVALLAKSTSIISGSSMEQTPTSSIEATDTPIIESPTPTTAPVYVDPDPIVNCDFSATSCKGQTISVKRSLCSQTTCCGFNGGKWIPYANVVSCDADQAKENQNNNQNTNQQQNNYPPCTVNYALGIVQTYYDVSPETCKVWQDEANAGNTRTAQPTVDYAAQNQANIQLQSQCKVDSANYYQQQITSVRSNHTLGDSSKQNAITSLNNQANQAAQACESKYPTN